MKTIVTKEQGAMELIEKAVRTWDRICVFCSFGKDSIVVLHLALRVNPNIEVVSIMTRFKPKATFKYLEKIRDEWNLNLEVHISREAIPVNLFKTDPDECCRINKVEPAKMALKNYDAWISGLRRTEGGTRTDFEYIEESSREFMSEDGTITKVNPILDWHEVDIWKYIAIHGIPVHPWYAKGYRSLGCEPCSRIVDDGDTERAGRWQNTSKCGGECGIHTMHKRRS
jgi:phosphoadenosine phosphosulfate reductase